MSVSFVRSHCHRNQSFIFCIQYFRCFLLVFLSHFFYLFLLFTIHVMHHINQNAREYRIDYCIQYILSHFLCSVQVFTSFALVFSLRFISFTNAHMHDEIESNWKSHAQNLFLFLLFFFSFSVLSFVIFYSLIFLVSFFYSWFSLQCNCFLFCLLLTEW